MIAALIVLALFLSVFFGIAYVVLATPVKDKPKRRRREVIRIKKRAQGIDSKN